MIKSSLRGSIYSSSTQKSFSSSWNLRHPTTIFFPSRICYDKDILLDGCSFFYKTWFDKGVYLIQDLLDTDGKVMSYAKFKEKYLLSCNFLTYFQVISAIPKKFIESAKVTSLEKNRLPVKKCFPAFIRNLCKPP